MSATMDARIYRNYFTNYQQQIQPSDLNLRAEVETLFVGSVRYPVKIHFLEDILSSSEMGVRTTNEVKRRLFEGCENIKNSLEKIPNSSFVSAQFELAVHLIRTIAKLGTAVLVFVSGIADIDQFVSYFEGLARYQLVCIHSQIPLEEQENAFIPTPPSEIKVIVATNSAESSVTLPDVDIVICLGRENLLVYNERHQRLELLSTMITQASATQRAGRTGRVQSGQVFRLYTLSMYNSLRLYSESEVSHVPLHDLIVKFRGLLDRFNSFNGVVPILTSLPSPPPLESVSLSFQYLHECGLITEPSDGGALTPPGRFISQMGVDMSSGRFLVYGTMLGIMDEAIIIASAWQLPRSPFRFPSLYTVKDPNVFNSRRQKIFLELSHFDEGSYSEPIMLLNLFLAWSETPRNLSQRWCQKHQLDPSLMHEWNNNVEILRSRAHNLCNGKSNPIPIPKPLLWNLLRLCFVWCGEDNLLQMNSPERGMKEVNRMTFEGDDSLTTTKIENLIPQDLTYHRNVLMPLITYSLIFPIQSCPRVDEIFRSSYFQTSVSHNFKFTILSFVAGKKRQFHFFVSNQYQDYLAFHFPLLEFTNTPHQKLSAGWTLIEFVDLNPSQIKPISSSDVGVLQMMMTFHKNGLTLTTNCQKVKSILSALSLHPTAVERMPQIVSRIRTEFIFCDENPPETLFPDVPKGIRLFNCLLRGRKDR
jgi:hypothetical protein